MSTRKIPTPVKFGAPLAAAAFAISACGGYGSSGAAASTSGSTGHQMASVVRTSTGSHGSFLVDGSGHSLYVFSRDKGAKSTCYGTCATFWPPAQVQGTPKAAGATSAAALGTAKRTDGTMQASYHGHPLYYFSQDSAPGDTNGQGRVEFGGKWTLVSTAGATVAAGTSTNGGSSSSGSGGSGGYGAGY